MPSPLPRHCSFAQQTPSHSFHQQTANQAGEAWIGLSDLTNPGTLSWVDGTQHSYGNYDPVQATFPGRRCGMTSTQTNWKYKQCNGGRGFVCRRRLRGMFTCHYQTRLHAVPFFSHSNWETGASEMHDRARDWSEQGRRPRGVSQLPWTRKKGTACRLPSGELTTWVIACEASASRRLVRAFDELSSFDRARIGVCANKKLGEGEGEGGEALASQATVNNG